jgi:predicted MFS family arabinose efflux permease
MLVAPRSTDMAVAVSSSTFNLGIATGSGLGAALVAGVGVHAVPLVGAALALLGLVAAGLEERFNAPLPLQAGRGAGRRSVRTGSARSATAP